MDPQYLDKNYGGIFILWDRMFGSFQPKTVRPNYGLTKQVDTYNIWTLQTHEYVAIVRDVRRRGDGGTASATFRPARLGAAQPNLAPPTWTPRRAAIVGFGRTDVTRAAHWSVS